MPALPAGLQMEPVSECRYGKLSGEKFIFTESKIMKCKWSGSECLKIPEVYR